MSALKAAARLNKAWFTFYPQTAAPHGSARIGFLACLIIALALIGGFGGQALARQLGPQTVAPVASKLVDAVVNISTSQTVKSASGAPLPRVPKGSPFEEFFNDFFSSKKGGANRASRKVSSLGSGFVIDAEAGLIVTNVHVIDGADEVIANFSDGSKLKVDKVVGRDSKTDLALLKVTPTKPLKAVKFGNSKSVQVGDWVMAIGNPFGLGGTVTVGIISAKARDINSGPYDEYLQTDAAINKGNSGGPLFNMEGEVIGVNTAIISPTGGSIGIGFAVPADAARRVVEQLRLHGEVRRGWLGVNVASVSEDLADQLKVRENYGAHVASVTNDSPADKGGIKVDDVIVSFDGSEIDTVRALPRIVSQTPVGKAVEVEVMRNGQRVKLRITVARLQENDPLPPIRLGDQPNERKLLGLTLTPLTDELRAKFSLKSSTKGIVITAVDADGPGAQRDLKVGEVIVEANDKVVSTVDQIVERIDKVRQSGRRQILLRIEDSKGRFRSVALPFR